MAREAPHKIQVVKIQGLLKVCCGILKITIIGSIIYKRTLVKTIEQYVICRIFRKFLRWLFRLHLSLRLYSDF